MDYKKLSIFIMLFSIVCIGIMVSSVSANENVTDDMVCIEEDNSLSVEKELSLDNDDNLKINAPDNPIEQDTEKNDYISSSNNEEILSMDNNSEKLEAFNGNAYIDGVTAIWGATKYVYLGWDGYFSGTFEVYKGSTCVHEEIINGYDRDLKWSTSGLSVGTYTAKLVYYDGKVIASSTINIQKSAVKVSVKSFTAKAGTTFYCYAYVTDKYDGANYNGGYVYFKINGKTYKAQLNDGVAIAKLKIPSKAKKYTCKATYNGDSNFNGATKTFKMTVKKIKYKTVTKKIKYKWLTTKVGKYKIKYRLWRVYHGFLHGYCNYVDICLYKNGKQLRPNSYLSTYHTKVNGKWKWMKWRHGGVDHAYHRYITDCKVNKFKIKFAV